MTDASNLIACAQLEAGVIWSILDLTGLPVCYKTGIDFTPQWCMLNIRWTIDTENQLTPKWQWINDCSIIEEIIVLPQVSKLEFQHANLCHKQKGAFGDHFGRSCIIGWSLIPSLSFLCNVSYIHHMIWKIQTKQITRNDFDSKASVFLTTAFFYNEVWQIKQPSWN